MDYLVTSVMKNKLHIERGANLRTMMVKYATHFIILLPLSACDNYV